MSMIGDWITPYLHTTLHPKQMHHQDPQVVAVNHNHQNLPLIFSSLADF